MQRSAVYKSLHKLHLFVEMVKCGLWYHLQLEVVTHHKLAFGIINDLHRFLPKFIFTLECRDKNVRVNKGSYFRH